MEIFRIFDWDGRSTVDSFGGPLYVPTLLQGKGRHDIPALTGVLYCAQSDTCAVVEAIQMFRGVSLSAGDFRRPGGSIRQALARLEVGDIGLPDLGNPETLSSHGWSTGQVISSDRPLTQRMAEVIHREGAVGFSWPSAVQAECRNITLFHDRMRGLISLRGSVVPLDTTLPAVQRAAKLLSVRIE